MKLCRTKTEWPSIIMRVDITNWQFSTHARVTARRRRVSGLLGLGRQLSQSTSDEGLKMQIFEYLPEDYHVEVTYVDGVVVRYSISSR